MNTQQVINKLDGLQIQANRISAKLWEKYGKTRIYLTAGRRDGGFVAIIDGEIDIESVDASIYCSIRDALAEPEATEPATGNNIKEMVIELETLYADLPYASAAEFDQLEADIATLGNMIRKTSRLSS